MICAQCDLPARAVCAFCGRGVCGEHAQSKTLYTGFGRVSKEGFLARGKDVGVTVRNAIWCGKCSVEYQETY